MDLPSSQCNVVSSSVAMAGARSRAPRRKWVDLKCEKQHLSKDSCIFPSQAYTSTLLLGFYFLVPRFQPFVSGFKVQEACGLAGRGEI